jgi:cbb3-type cytochrome oxidase subunit 3
VASASYAFVDLTACVAVRFDACSFNLSETRAFAANSSPDIKIVGCNFVGNGGHIANLTGSLLMVIESCFAPDSEDEDLQTRFQMDEDSIVHRGQEIAYHSWCPWGEITATLTAEQQAYAIATVVIFFFCFAVLFIGLIVFVFCKARKEEVKDTEAPQDLDIMDDGDIDIPSG